MKPFDSTSPFHHNKHDLNHLRALLLADENLSNNDYLTCSMTTQKYNKTQKNHALRRGMDCMECSQRSWMATLFPMGTLMKFQNIFYMTLGNNPAMTYATSHETERVRTVFSLDCQHSICGIAKCPTQALQLREIERRFHGPLPSHLHDERHVATFESSTADPLCEGEDVKALCFELGMSLGRKVCCMTPGHMFACKTRRSDRTFVMLFTYSAVSTHVTFHDLDARPIVKQLLINISEACCRMEKILHDI